MFCLWKCEKLWKNRKKEGFEKISVKKCYGSGGRAAGLIYTCQARGHGFYSRWQKCSVKKFSDPQVIQSSIQGVFHDFIIACHLISLSYISVFDINCSICCIFSDS